MAGARRVFVFGSNLAGRHGAGAARFASEKYGAIDGRGTGLQGSSYAIPTKDKRLKTLPLRMIAAGVHEFIMFARVHPELTFDVTRIGCGLAGYKDSDIAPMFTASPANVVLPRAWGGEGFDE